MPMLDDKDMKLLVDLFGSMEHRITTNLQQEIVASEQRMTAKIHEEIAASEQRMTTKMHEEIAASEQRIMKNVATLMDAEFKPRFDLLAEGQQAILDKLVPVTRVEAIEADVDVLKLAVRQISNDLAELKQAQ